VEVEMCARSDEAEVESVSDERSPTRSDGGTPESQQRRRRQRDTDHDGGVGSRNWRPPRAVTLLSVLAVAVPSAWLAVGLGVVDTAVTTVAGAVLVGLLVRLAGVDRFRPVAVAVAGVLLFPAGALVTAGTTLVFVSQFAGAAPVGAVFLVAALGLAAFGATGLVGGSVDTDAVVSAATVALAVGAGTVGAALPLVGRAVLENEAGLSLDAVEVERVQRVLVETVLAPDPTGSPAVGSLLVLLGLAALGFGETLRALPVRELLDDRTADESLAVAALDRTLVVLDAGWAAVGVGAPLWIVDELFPGLGLWGGLPAGLDDLLREVAAAPVPRALAIGVVTVSVAVVGSVRLVRGAYQTRLGLRTDGAGLVGGWLALLWFGWTRAPLTTDTLRDVLVGALPPTAGEAFTTQWEAVIAYYGVGTVGLGLVAAFVAAASVVVIGLAVAAVFGLLPPSGVGHGIASSGLLSAGGFGLAVGAGRPASLAALVAAVAVWDLGTYGVELGREVGRRAHSRGATFVHLGGTLLVSLVAAGGAVAAVELADRLPLSPTAPAAVVLLAGVAALVAFGIALRR
jgi:hypothetical protein